MVVTPEEPVVTVVDIEEATGESMEEATAEAMMEMLEELLASEVVETLEEPLATEAGIAVGVGVEAAAAALAGVEAEAEVGAKRKTGRQADNTSLMGKECAHWLLCSVQFLCRT